MVILALVSWSLSIVWTLKYPSWDLSAVHGLKWCTGVKIPDIRNSIAVIFRISRPLSLINRTERLRISLMTASR